jgi:predicted nucleotidyltransferase
MESLGTKTSIKLLLSLLESPFHEFSETELIRKASTGKGSAGIAIGAMAKDRILIEKREGRTKLLSLNMKNPSFFLIYGIYSIQKLRNIPGTKLAAALQFKNEVKMHSDMVAVFGSTTAGTSGEKSDIDILAVSSDIGALENARSKLEVIFGERFNLHVYTKEDIFKKFSSDPFVRNAVVNGAVLHGYDLTKELLGSTGMVRDINRLFFLHSRISAAIRNYFEDDRGAAMEIAENVFEQATFYLLSEHKINFTSKKDSRTAARKIPEWQILNKIYKFPLKKRIESCQRFIMDMLEDRILEEEGYAKR